MTISKTVNKYLPEETVEKYLPEETVVRSDILKTPDNVVHPEDTVVRSKKTKQPVRSKKTKQPKTWNYN